MSTPAVPLVGIGIIPVPDGIDHDDSLKLSLVIAPDVTQHNPGVALGDWPGAIADLLAGSQGLRLQFFHPDHTAIFREPIRPRLHRSIQLARAVDAAHALWKDMFPPSQLVFLHEILTENAGAKAAHEDVDIDATMQYQASHIRNIVCQLKYETIGVTLRARLIEAEQRSAWAKVPPDSVQDRRAHANAQAPYRFVFERRLQNALARALDARTAGGPEYRIGLRLRPDNAKQMFTVDRRSASRWLQEHSRDSYYKAVGKDRPGRKGTQAAFAAEQFGKDFPSSSAHRAIQIDALLLGTAPAASGRGLTFEPRDSADMQASISEELGMELATSLQGLSDAFAPATSASHTHDAKNADEDAREAVRFKYSGLLAHPTLAKLLNLIVDVTLPAADAAQLPPTGFVKAYLAQGSGKQGALVAYRLQRSPAQPATFRPLAAQEAPAKHQVDGDVKLLSLPLRDGCVDLGQERFQLASTDVHAVANSTRVKLQELYSARLEGADSGSQSARHAEERNRGIQLFDSGATPQLMAAASHVQKGHEVYAEQLITGYRVFVQRVARPGAAPQKWRTLMARSVTYERVARIYPPAPGQNLPAWEPYKEFQEREFGQVRPVPRVEKQPGLKLRSIPPSHVFSWMGESLGLPPPSDEDPLNCDEIRAEWERIGMRMTYDYAADPDYVLPALRVGSAYTVGMAPVYLNGGGPTLQEARNTFLARPDITISGARKDGPPFVFPRSTDIQCPNILLPADDRLVTRTPRPINEHAERIVLRTGAGEDTREVNRLLVPPRVDFSTAEQYAVFDRDNSDQPRGAFERYQIDPTTGDFPKIDVKGEAGRRETVQVLGPDRDWGPHQRPYYPDPIARNLGMGFEREERVPAGYPDNLPRMSFWNRGADDPRACLKARPIALEFRRWPEARRGGRVLTGSDWTETGESDQRLPKVTVQLAPAEEATMWVWCWPDLPPLIRSLPEHVDVFARNFVLSETAPATALVGKFKGIGADRPSAEATETGMSNAQLAASKALAQQMRSLGSPGNAAAGADADAGIAPGFKEAIDAIYAALSIALPLNGVTGWRKIEMVHAVAKPRNTPSVYRKHFYPVRLLPGMTLEQHCGGCAPDAPPESQAGGTRVLFSGLIGFDRASTRSVRVEANWPILAHAQAIRNINAGTSHQRPHFVDRPPRIDQVLFDIQDIPRHSGDGPEAILDLLKDEAGRFRELSTGAGTFGSSPTAACKLNLRIVATSRFSEYFIPEPADRPAHQLGKFEVETRPYYSGRGAPANLVRTYEFILPATVRPPAPVVSKVEWIAPEQRSQAGAHRLVVRKHYFPRLYLDESWRISGEDELLAVVFIPSKTIEDRKYDPRLPVVDLAAGALAPERNIHTSLADEFARFVVTPVNDKLLPPGYCASPGESPLCTALPADALSYVTRWGSDPVAAPMGRMEAQISPNRFRGHVGAVSRVDMPPPDSPDDRKAPTAPIEVGALLYKPQLDPDNGLWFVDIGIDPGAAHAPFVRLAVSRYQPHALYKGSLDLRMSQPLVMDPIRVPASRTVEVCYIPNKPIEVTVYGVGYLRREPYGVSQEVRHLTDMPLQSVELMRRPANSADGFVPVFAADGTPLRQTGIQALAAGPNLSWKATLTPPWPDRPVQYGLHINEFDMHIPDRVLATLARKRGAGNAPRASGPGDLEARPGFFSMMIELDKLEEVSRSELQDEETEAE